MQTQISLENYIGIIADRLFCEYLNHRYNTGGHPEPESFYDEFKQRYPKNRLNEENWTKVWGVFLELVIFDNTMRKV